jgi:hypothetical protein
MQNMSCAFWTCPKQNYTSKSISMAVDACNILTLGIGGEVGAHSLEGFRPVTRQIILNFR